MGRGLLAFGGGQGDLYTDPPWWRSGLGEFTEVFSGGTLDFINQTTWHGGAGACGLGGGKGQAGDG